MMSLELTHSKLGWPSRDRIFDPPGEGARVYARLARDKLGGAIALRPDAADTEVGVLSPNPDSSDSVPPLAVVCEFGRQVSAQTLCEMQKLAWNFSRCPMLVTVEPHLLRVWTCCEPPGNRLITDFVVKEVPTAGLAKATMTNRSAEATQALHWVNLVSGQFFKENAPRFHREQRADQMLLENLRFVRQQLHDIGLTNDDVCHDLLARIIFIQFLFHRKDSSGTAALNPAKLEWLHDQNILQDEHEGFSSILADYAEAYRLFDWLNDRFNGDLFPGKGNTESERERGWQTEKRFVKPKHLEVLERLVSGNLDMPKGQLCLWPQYAFDAIPLEFISSIYEAFARERARSDGIYYTPPHLVDFMLDRTLPWGGTEWDLKILDPACGSGVFLVKAFQRLIHRWKKAHPDENMQAEVLRHLLEHNLFGVDKDPHAVRVASFSLYLAMCDEIDPKRYWTQVKFPLMREKRLINADFFQEDKPGFRTNDDADSYDLAVGNAPWGEDVPLSEYAKTWADHKAHSWPVANKGIGQLFLPKAAALTKQDGKVAMIQSASSLLFNRGRPARGFREQFFTAFHVEKVINLSALRFRVFNKKKGSAQKAVAPPCVVIFQPKPPTGDYLFYISPKLAENTEEEFQIVVEPQDVKKIRHEEAAKEAEIWTALMWGGRRDWVFVRRLRQMLNIEAPGELGPILFREGVIVGDQQKKYEKLRKRRILETKGFPPGTSLYLQSDRLPTFDPPLAHSRDSTDFRSFTMPQLIIKQSWQKKAGRFQAALTRNDGNEGVLCTQSYVTIHVPQERANVLDAACLSYNSILAVYFLLLTSSRFASYRPEPLVEELLRVPIPQPRAGLLDGIKRPEDADTRVREVFGFKDAEWVLVEDLFNITLADFKGDANSSGRQPTKRRVGSMDEPDLRNYCEYFMRVLKAGFGKDKSISATVFHETAAPLLSYRLVAFHLNHELSPPVQLETLDSPTLIAELERLNQTWLRTQTAKSGSVYCQRVARIYDHRNKAPTIYIVKPDARRYWTRSMGLHDADEVAADILSWRAAEPAGRETRRR
jgi:hypothetical protein